MCAWAAGTKRGVQVPARGIYVLASVPQGLSERTSTILMQHHDINTSQSKTSRTLADSFDSNHAGVRVCMCVNTSTSLSQQVPPNLVGGEHTRNVDNMAALESSPTTR